MSRATPKGGMIDPDPAEPVRNAAGEPISRFHNQEDQSIEALARSVAELTGSLRALELRLGEMGGELGGRIDGAEQRADLTTRRLAVEVAEMGGALARRLRAAEAATPFAAPPPRPAARRSHRIGVLAWGVALAASLAAAGLVVWLLFAPPSTPVVAAAPAPTPRPAASPPLVAPAPAAPEAIVASPAPPVRRPPHPVHHHVRAPIDPPPVNPGYHSFGPAPDPN